MDGIGIEAPRKRRLLGRLLDGIVESRTRRARGIAKPYLLALDDEDLARLGHSRADVETWESRPGWAPLV
jgi:hypothetical protein